MSKKALTFIDDILNEKYLLKNILLKIESCILEYEKQ